MTRAQPIRPRRHISHAPKKNAAANNSARPTMPTIASVWTGWSKYTTIAAQAPVAPISMDANKKTR